MKKKQPKIIKDNARNRLRAIEEIVNGDYSLDAEDYEHNPERLKDMSREGLQKLTAIFGQMITDCYILSHGYNSKCWCCKGKGRELMETLLEYEKPTKLQKSKKDN